MMFTISIFEQQSDRAEDAKNDRSGSFAFHAWGQPVFFHGLDLGLLLGGLGLGRFGLWLRLRLGLGFRLRLRFGLWLGCRLRSRS